MRRFETDFCHLLRRERLENEMDPLHLEYPYFQDATLILTLETHSTRDGLSQLEMQMGGPVP
eukprot:912341-Prymnesium_polylepis.2